MPRNTQRILIVDDSPTIRKMIRSEFEKLDFELQEAENGTEALQKIEDFKPNLVTLDVEMPDMEGYQVCSELRGLDKGIKDGERKLNQTPVIFVTSNDTLEGRRKGFLAGGTEFVTKPFVKGEVKNAVLHLLQQDKDLQGITALVVEDNKIIRQLISRTLQSENIESVEASNGIEALEILKSKEHFIDFILTDYDMPLMDGIELCHTIRTKLCMKDIPILFLTGMEDQTKILEIFKTGATDYLTKPFAKEELFARLKVHLRENILKKELRQKVIDLKRINKVKDEFLAIASHDLKSPLNGIIGFAELLKEVEYLQEEEKEFVEYILTSGEFLLTLINDILDLSKIESESFNLELEPLDLKPIVDTCIHGMNYAASLKEIKIEMEAPKVPLPKIMGDKNALTRVVNNLLSNAVKFTPKKGMIKIMLNHTEQKKVSLAVIDTGIGIPKDKLPYLFDRYSKTSQKGTEGEKSTGLGMSITKELVEKHNGSIQVESQVNFGSCFTVEIPSNPA